jgi:2-methylcitrate dehydratase PrpD
VRHSITKTVSGKACRTRHPAIIGAAGAILSAMSGFNEIASVVVRFDHVASGIINVDYNIM